MAPYLTTDEVMGLLTYEGSETTNELSALGTMLLAECMDRGKQLDARAIALSGYSGVTAALLISTFAQRLDKLPWWPTVFIIAAGVSLFAATALAFSALWIREFEWFSDKDWFCPSKLGNADHVKRSHVIAMHCYRGQHEEVNTRKAAFLTGAYCALTVCGAMLAAGLVAIRL